MKKTSLTRALLVAGGLALAGIGAAQADAIFYPDGTMVNLGPTGADNLALSSDSSLMAMDNSVSDTTVLGAGPATTTTTTTTVTAPVQYEYVQPNINWDRSTALNQVHHNRQAMRRIHRGETPLASSDAIVVGSYSIPYTAVSGNPYYVFSY